MSPRHPLLTLPRRVRFVLLLLLVPVGLCSLSSVQAEGEPAENFLAELRRQGYSDTAIAFLDRLNEFPGVNEDLKSAIALEKALTHIDAGKQIRGNRKEQDAQFAEAEKQLNEFLKVADHPRHTEAQQQLAYFQLVRGAYLMVEPVDDEKRKLAGDTYLAAATTFDGIIASLKTKLEASRARRLMRVKNLKKSHCVTNTQISTSTHNSKPAIAACSPLARF